ncbi:MAG: YkgJ family cysteine cluster protein [Synergistaceae bacterium]
MSKKPKNNKKNNLPKKRTNLRSVLQSIYHDNVNLETTCNHACDCCNIAMPQINYSEFIQIATIIWKEKSHEEILNIICKSLEYFVRYEYEKWGKDTLIKPCMFLGENKRCTIYEDRPLNCRLYGLWPEEIYEDRVLKFAEAYKQYGLKREDLPLNRQCPYVKRVDNEVPITNEIIESLFERLDELDKTTGGFSSAQVRQKENYRTFHDWLLLKILGEEWLSQLTTFILAADREIMEDQIKAMDGVMRENFKTKIPDINKIV